ncbi:MAG TPA: hypothetical protein VNH53_08945 [Sphingomicrobium sp.]|nr:hypothetical protein [Sphingomicrobium sp.]
MSNELHPHELAKAALEALDGRADLDLLWHYLTVAIEEHDQVSRKFIPADHKLAALSLKAVLEQLRDMADSQGDSSMILKVGHRGSGRPRTKNTPNAEREAQRKRRGIFLYERLISEGAEPKNALADAAKEAGMVRRNFERVLQARRVLDDPEQLAEYVMRGPEERYLAFCAERARTHFSKGRG